MCRAAEYNTVLNGGHKHSEYFGQVLRDNPQSTATRRRHSPLATTANQNFLADPYALRPGRRFVLPGEVGPGPMCWRPESGQHTSLR